MWVEIYALLEEEQVAQCTYRKWQKGWQEHARNISASLVRRKVMVSDSFQTREGNYVTHKFLPDRQKGLEET